jgi:hypothetical protein
MHNKPWNMLLQRNDETRHESAQEDKTAQGHKNNEGRENKQIHKPI